MLCITPHINWHGIEKFNGSHMYQVNNFIKTLLCDLSYVKFHVTIYILWSEYTDSNHNNGHFDDYKWIYRSKFICDGNSHLWHQNYSSPCTKVLGFVACKVTSKIIGMVSSESSCSDVKMIKSGERYAISSIILG